MLRASSDVAGGQPVGEPRSTMVFERAWGRPRAPGRYAAIAALFAAAASFIGGSPNIRPYSRVNCETLS